MINDQSQDCDQPQQLNCDQLKWLCEISMRRLESAHRDYDTINTRSGVVIGFAGVFNSLLLPTWITLPKIARVYSGFVWLFMALLMLFFAFSAYQVAEVESIPLKRKTVETYLEIPEYESRLQFISDVIVAADRMAIVNQRKAMYLGRAITALSLQIFLSISVIILGRIFY
jgi:hypothetical protein